MKKYLNIFRAKQKIFLEKAILEKQANFEFMYKKLKDIDKIDDFFKIKGKIIKFLENTKRLKIRRPKSEYPKYQK